MEAEVLAALAASEGAMKVLNVEYTFGAGGQDKTVWVDFTNLDADDGAVETLVGYYENGELVIDLA